MNKNMGFRLFCVLFSLVLLAGLTGCRTYGGYGTEEKVRVQISRANEAFASELERARNLLPALQQRIGGDENGATIINEYQSLLTAHATLLEQNRQIEEALSGGEGYRTLNRVFGSILSEQKVIRNRYRALLNNAQGIIDTTAVARGEVVPESYYVVRPPFYERIANTEQSWLMTTSRTEAVDSGAVGMEQGESEETTESE